MQTDDLINDLSSELQRVPRYAADRRLGLHLGVGAIASFIAMLLILGVRPDIADASRTAPFWLKWIYTFVLSTGAFVCVRRLANPIGRLGLVWLWIAAPFAMVVVGALWELAHTPAGLVHQDMFGHTAARCAISISLLSVPILLALVIAFRKFAPTRLGLTGVVAGLASSSIAAAIYAFACPETTLAFMALWYSAGFVASSTLGWLAATRLMRW